MKYPSQLSLLVTTDSEGHYKTLDHSIPWWNHPGRRLLERQVCGCPVLVGRRTFEHCPQPLPGAYWLMLSRTVECSTFGILTVHNVREALIASQQALEVFVLGGLSLFEIFLPLSGSIYWLEINQPLDTLDKTQRFPSLDQEWKARMMAKAREYKLWKFTRAIL